jgi:hypothetical protein
MPQNPIASILDVLICGRRRGSRETKLLCCRICVRHEPCFGISIAGRAHEPVSHARPLRYTRFRFNGIETLRFCPASAGWRAAERAWLARVRCRYSARCLGQVGRDEDVKGGEAAVRDVKDVIGVIMRVLDGAEISQDDVLDLEFEAEGELLAALNEAYIKLLEFAHDREQRLGDRHLDAIERATLQHVLNVIVRLSDVESK